jgi:hypothetical protein
MIVIDTHLLGVGTRLKHPIHGDGVIIRLHPVAYEICFMLYGIKTINKNYERFEIIQAIEADTTVTFSEAEKSLTRILRTWANITEEVPLGDKWDGGTLILKSKDPNIKPKEMPIDTFFHKIVMTRDRLRVMEQRINASALSDEEKVNLQQYITRIYGSLTSFNVLFRHKEHHFVGDKMDN